MNILTPCAVLTLATAQTAVAMQMSAVHAALRLGEAWLGAVGRMLPDARQGRRRMVRILSDAELVRIAELKRLVPRFNGRGDVPHHG